MNLKRLALAVAVLAAAPDCLAQTGALRAEFYQFTRFAGGAPKGDGPSYTSTDATTTMAVTVDPNAQVTVAPGPLGVNTIAVFGHPIHVSAAASASWTAPHSTDAGKTFHASFQVLVRDGYTSSIVNCSGNLDSRSVASDQTATFSSTVTCEVPTASIYNNSRDFAITGFEFDALLTTESATGNTVVSTPSAEAQYKVLHGWDSVSYFGTEPPFSSTAPLVPGALQGFTGDVTASLGTKEEGDVQIAVIGPGGSVLGASPTVRVKRNDAAKHVSIPAFTLPAQDTTVFLVALLTEAGTQNALASSFVAYSVRDTALSGLIRRSAGGKDYWLPGVTVELYEVSGSVETKIGTTRSTLGGTPDHPRSEYAFKTKDLTKPIDLTGGKLYRLRARLEDGDPSASSFFVALSGPNFNEPLDLFWKPLAIRTAPAKRDLNATDAGGLEPEFLGMGEYAAEAYWHSFRQVHFMIPIVMPAGFHLSLRPVRILLDLTGSDAHYSPPRSLGEPVALGAPPDALWHDWGSHLYNEIWGGSIPAAPALSDPLLRQSLVSAGGFPYFWAASSARVLDKVRDGTVRLSSGKAKSLELNEGYVASFLWDLVDRHVDGETRLINSQLIPVEDQLTLDLSDVLAQIASPVVDPRFDFVIPRNVGELVARLNARYPALAGPWTNGLSLMENVVALQRIPGQVFARPFPRAQAVTSSPLDTIAGSFIAVTLVAPDGSPVAASRLDIDFVFGPGYETQNRKESRRIVAGNVYFEMPDAHYPVQAFLSIPGSPETPLMIDNAAYWAAVPTTADHFLSHTFLVPSDVPQIDLLFPAYAAAGTQVQLIGRNFASVPASNVVLFGTTRATVLSAGPTLLVVNVPAISAATVPVAVTSAGNLSNSVDFDVLAPALSVTPPSLDLGGTAAGTTAQKIVTVRNGGEAPLVISSVAVTGPFAVLPSVTPATSITLDAGASQVFTVGFTPHSPAPASGTLVISTNDVVHHVADVPLSGTGGAASGPDIVTTPGALDFGTVAVTQNRSASLTVKNRGTASLAVTAATFGGTTFSLVSPALPLALAAGAEQTFTLRFTPAAMGSYADTLSLASSDPDEPKHKVSLTGVAVKAGTATSACTYAVTPGSLAAGPGSASGSAAIAAGAGCAWTAASSDSFVVLGAAAGSGGGSVPYTIAANNTGVPRGARLTIAGTTLYVTQDADPDVTATVPIVLTTAGLNGSTFTSELTLTNRGQADAIAQFTYTAAFGSGSGAASDVVPAGAQLTFPDALEYLRSLGVPIPATGSQGGTLRVDFFGLTSPTSASATVRTTSIVPDGRAGLAYGSVPRNGAPTGTSYLCGLRQNAQDRSNVAVINAGRAGDGDIAVRLTVFSGDPANPTSRVLNDITLSPGGFAQVNGILAANGLGLSNGWVKVERVSGTAPYIAYGVINDQANSDGSFVSAVSAQSLVGKTGVTLPVVVEAGAFSTELVVTNFGSVDKTFQVTFVADGVTAANNTASIAFTLKGGEQRILSDFVQYLRDHGIAGVGAKGSASFAGAAFLTVASGDVSGLFIGARTSSPGNVGRYGLFYTGVPYGAASVSSVWLYGLQQNADNRSNLAIVNTGETDGSSDTFQVQIYNGATGFAAGSFTLTLGPRKWTQVNAVLTQYAAGVPNAYVKVTRTSGNNPFLAYAVVNDGGVAGQRSGDGAFITMDTSP